MAKRGITYVKGEEPAFLKRFKEKAGFVEGPGVNEKFKRDEAKSSGPDENEEIKDDEQPMVVRLKDEHLTQAEAEKEWQRAKTEGELRLRDEEGVGRGPPVDAVGKIRFRKPKEKTENDKDEKKQKTDETEKREKRDKTVKKERREKKRDVKAVKDSKLLSFGDEDEEEEET